jgi:hypothetical protein
LEIKNNHPELLENSFSFSSIYPDFVEKRINKINVKKATGIDGKFFDIAGKTLTGL